MFCTNCGSPLEEGAKFCVNCGTPVEESAPETAQEAPKAERVPETAQEAPKAESVPKRVTEQKTKGNFLTVAILAVAAVVIVAVVVLVGTRIFGGSSEDVSKQVAFVKNDALYFVKNMDKKKEPVRIMKLKNADSYTPVYFSEDKSYLYFVTRMSAGSYGKLCRVQLSKLKADEEKNEELVEEIDSAVNAYSVQLQGDGIVLYKRENGNLYCFDGKDSQEIADDVIEWAYDEETNTVAYTQKNSDETSKLLVKPLSSDADAVELDDKIEEIYELYDPGYIVYKKNIDEETYSADLYAAGISLEAEKIASDVRSVLSCDTENKTVHYSVDVSEEKPLYDYVEDSYADTDADLKEPEIKDYFTPVTAEQALTTSDYSNYNLYVVNATEEIDPVDAFESFWAYLNFDDELNMYNYYKSENGVYEEYYYDEVTSQWYFYDEDKWEAAQETYEEAGDRIELRKALKEEIFTSSSDTVYRSTYGKKPEKILEGAVSGSVSVNTKSDLISYQRKDAAAVKVNMEDIYDSYDVRDKIYNAENEAQTICYYRIGDGEEQEMEQENISYLNVSPDGKMVSMVSYSENNETEIYLGEISGTEIKDLELLTDEGEVVGWVDSNYYYFDKVKDGYGSLYKYSGGKSTKLSKDISTSGVYVYQKDYIMAYSDYNYDTGLGDLVLYEKGEDTKISRDVKSYSYIDKKRIVFLKEEDLCVYTGSDDIKKIEKNVDYYYCPGEMGIDNWYVQ